MCKETISCFMVLAACLFLTGCSDGGGKKSCETSADCEGSQICDPVTHKCRDVVTCADLDCGVHRLCQEAADGQDAECLDQCESGYVWNPGTGTCDPATTCAQLDCESQNRECIEDAAGARCGDCLAGYQEDQNGDCVEFSTCEPYVAGSILQDCDDAGRECVEDVVGEAECGDCKSAWQILDPDTGICRDKQTCEDITCDPGLFCLEPPDGDAYCSENCQDSEGNPGIVNPEGVCILCESCDDASAGEDGPYLDELSGEGRCICKTLDGYYWQEGEPYGVTPCDRDQDGWVRHSAKVALESPSNAIRVNARCHVRSIDNFVLHNEAGQELSIPAGGVSMFESDRNDDQDMLDQALAENDQRIPPYPTDRALKAEELNSLTKACVSVDADYNNNSVEDINECEGAALGTGYEAYEPFVDFAYFVELHRARFEPVSGDAGNYHIYEKSRTRIEDGWRVPLVYPPDPSNPEKQVYWRECAVKRDSAYAGAGSNKQGLDFGQFAEDVSDPANPWYGMNHHSLFKCLHISSTPPGPSRPLNEMTRQEALDEGYAVNDCAASSTSMGPGPEGWDAKNPYDPVVSCAAVDAADVPVGGVMWAVSGYRYYGDPAAYVRGCVNECAETVETCPACPLTRESCEGYDPDQPWRSQCQGDPANFGSLYCGCALNYGGATCEHRCEGGDPRQIDDFATQFTRLFLGTNFSDPPRSGYWMCAGPVQTAYEDAGSPLMEGGGYKLFGRIPNELRTTGQVLCTDPPDCTAGGYRIH
jgi:hypothetical protein